MFRAAPSPALTLLRPLLLRATLALGRLGELPPVGEEERLGEQEHGVQPGEEQISKPVVGGKNAHPAGMRRVLAWASGQSPTPCPDLSVAWE